MRTVVAWCCSTLLMVSAAAACAGKKENPAALTVARIFGSDELDTQPVDARWLDDGSGYTVLERAPGGRGMDIVRYDAASGRREVLVPAAQLVPPGQSAPLEIGRYSFSKNLARVLIQTNVTRVWRRTARGDCWVLDRTSRELRKLGGDARPAALVSARFSPTGTHVAYVRDNNIYAEDLRSGEITALTTSGSAKVFNGTFDWVYQEELDLADGLAWSPDGRSLAYWQLDTHGVPEFSITNNTDGLYPKTIRFAYPKVGQRNAACRVGVVDLKDRRTRWLEVPGDPREHYIARVGWAAGSAEILVQQLNRLQNANRLVLADARTGRVRPLFTERDAAWVDVHEELFWLPGGKECTWISERDGWRHAYIASRATGQLRLVTPGTYDVIELLHADGKDGWLYFLASPGDPVRQYLYRVRIDGTGLEGLTPAAQVGHHDYKISPDGRWAIHTWSSFGTPPIVELVDLRRHKTIRALADNRKLRDALARLKQGRCELFRVDIGGGVVLDAWCINPPGLDPKNPHKKHPLLIHVYGEPAGRTVVDQWGGKNYLWHLMLAQRGYVVMSFENRGTPAPRGRAWRKAIYRQIGILAPADQAAALRQVLKDRPYVDPQRVGIWGASGGGSMSLNAIFKFPDLYQLAMALAPVANQRYYDTIYQERYMGLPEDNVQGYREGSPITHAQRLRGKLLLVHGTGDDNCHYQATEALINELVRCNKPFTMMAYPNRSHSISEGAGTTRHLRELLARYLEENLPPGPTAAAVLKEGPSAATKPQASWTSLFNGKDLDGWVVKCRPEDKDKTGYWKVADGAITAETPPGSKHNYIWLLTEKEYGDFELKMKVQTYSTTTANSGIQVRSRYDGASGVLDGPQVDIHPPGPWRCGFLYDETRGSQGWLWPDVGGPANARPAHAPKGWKWSHADDSDAWNDVLILCRGTRIKTVINGVTVADYNGAGKLDDAVHRRRHVGMKGHIALQIHPGDQLLIRFKDIQVRKVE